MISTVHVVPLRPQGPGCGLASALALVFDRSQRPLVLTLADFGKATHGTVDFLLRKGGRKCVRVDLVASVPVPDAEAAFNSLDSRGWRCHERRTAADYFVRTSAGRGATENFRLFLWRAATGVGHAGLDPSAGLAAAWGARPEASWVGSPVRVVTAAFGAGLANCAVTKGVMSNISSPFGLLLFDARCVDGSAGGAVELQVPGGALGRGLVVACVAPTLQSRTGEAVAFSVGLPLPALAAAICASEASLQEVLAEDELRIMALAAGLADAPMLDRPGRVRRAEPARAQVARSARRGVVLLWLEPSGSWASGVVVSELGHMITCAHLLTGHSWVEIPPSEKKARERSGGEARSSPPRPVRPPRCRGRGAALDQEGNLVETEFDADILHIHEGSLDVALLRARSSDGQQLRFLPLPWHEGLSLQEGMRVWAVGHGLFGPGTPWVGATITQGHIAKIAGGTAMGRPAVLQSSAPVHRGCSGGALVDAECGALVGLITTNVKHQDGTIMPHVNFSLPVDCLSPLRAFLAADPDMPAVIELIRAFDEVAADEQERKLWRLEPENAGLPSAMEARKRLALCRMQELAKSAEEAVADADGTKQTPPFPEGACARPPGRRGPHGDRPPSSAL